MITDKQVSAGVDAENVERGVVVDEEAVPSTRYSHRGAIPPVAPLRDTVAGPTASERAFGEVGHVKAAANDVTDEDASKSPGPIGSRFGSDGDLGDVERGAKSFKVGDTGPAVRKVQQALWDLNYRPIEVTGTYDQMTADHVQHYQQKHKLTRQDGTLDSTTFQALEKEFFNLSVYASAARSAPPGIHDTPKGQDPAKAEPVMLTETRAVDAADKAEATAVINPPEARDTSAFVEKGYETDLEAALKAELEHRAKSAEAKEKHHKKGPLFSLDQMAHVANAAKGEVDKVFGRWAVGGTFAANKNLKDRYTEERHEQSKMTQVQQRKAARSRAEYLVNNHLQHVDKAHHADRSTGRAKEIAASVIDRVTDANIDKLLTITATWSANTEPNGDVRVQLQRSGDDDTDRDSLWSWFGTFVHEYIHSLANPEWRKHRETVAGSQAKNTLREGVTELLARTVLSQVATADPALDKQVLGGAVSDEKGEVDLTRNAYGEAYARALELVGVIGIHNLYAAYFLGRVELLAL